MFSKVFRVVLFVFHDSGAPETTRGGCSVVWPWMQLTATSCLRTAFRSASEDFTCCTVCITVRRPVPVSRSEPQLSVDSMIDGSVCHTGPSPSCLCLQIRLALKDWEEVMKFEKDAVYAQHLDVVYVLRQLMSCKAFHFTAMPVLVSFKSQTSGFILKVL